MLQTSRWVLPLARAQSTSLRALSSSRPNLNPIRRDPLKRSSQRLSSKIQAPQRKPQQSRAAQISPHPSEPKRSDPLAVSKALRAASSSQNSLVAPVHVPDDPNGVLTSAHPASRMLETSSIVIQRQLEMMNLLVGFEQANKYVIMDGRGTNIGYLIEQELGVGNVFKRQAFGTHRAFTAHVLDSSMREVLRIHRPFSYISSRISVYDAAGADFEPSPESSSATDVALPTELRPIISSRPLSDMRIIGEAQQQWAPLRRKYNLFVHRDEKTADQFAHVNEPFLSWDFSLRGEDGSLVGSVNRNFSGLARELFADVGVYVLQMDSAQPDAKEADGSSSSPSMTLDQRAVMLATAVSIDFDYFSRSRGGMGFMPLWMMGGGEGAGVGAAGAGAEAAGVGAVGAEAAGVGVATAGAAAGMGAMRGGMDGVGEQPPSQPEQNSDWDKWDGNDGSGDGGGSSRDAGAMDPETGAGGGGDGDGSAADVISDFFGL